MENYFQGTYTEQDGYRVYWNGAPFVGASGFRPDQEFSFGYTGGGCQKLAFEMIYLAIGDPLVAQKALHDFTEDVIQELPSSVLGWYLLRSEIEAYMAAWGSGRRMTFEQLRYQTEQRA